MHANLGYQPEVSTKFQLNRTVQGWEIAIFVCPKQTKKQTKKQTNKQTNDIHESRWAGKNHSPLQLKLQRTKTQDCVLGLGKVIHQVLKDLTHRRPNDT
jgi:hypothetical protein